MNANAPCPCGLPSTYAACCGRFIERKAIAETPEQLMRSRYTAYTLLEMRYIEETMSGFARQAYDEYEARTWAEKADWQGLDVVRAPVCKPNATQGEVEFKAHYLSNGEPKCLHEISVFHKLAGHWYYVSGKQGGLLAAKKSVPRNAPCPCGSGKKFKKCCYQR